MKMKHPSLTILSGVRFLGAAGRCSVRFHHQRSFGVILFCLCFMFLAFLLALSVTVQYDNARSVTAPLIMILAAFTATCLAAIYVSLVLSLNTHVLTIGADEIKYRTGPVPWFGRGRYSLVGLAAARVHRYDGRSVFFLQSTASTWIAKNGTRTTVPREDSKPKSLALSSI
jgi:hypothetical protein